MLKKVRYLLILCFSLLALSGEAKKSDVLPELGDLMPCKPVQDELFLISSAQMSPGCEQRFNKIPFFFASDSNERICYIAVRVPDFKTSEGISVGSTLAAVKVAGAKPGWYETGWAFHAELPSGWHAAVFWLKDEEPPQDTSVGWLFKRK